MTHPNDKLLYDPKFYHNVPSVDRPSHFISDYKDIEVKVDDLATFAKSLQDELEQNYVPHRDKVAVDLTVGDVYTNQSFTELISALTKHAEIRQAALNRLYGHADGTNALSTAADKISKSYGAADAYSAASARDVSTVLTDPKVATNDTPVNTNTITSPNGVVTIPAIDTTVTVPNDNANPDGGTQIRN
jgi:hypothetical protein